MEKTTIERDAEKQESVEEREKEGKTRTDRRRQRWYPLKLTCPEPYFLSEGLYATPEELENTREIILHVITIGAFIEDSTKFINLVQLYGYLEYAQHFDEDIHMPAKTVHDVFLFLENSDEAAEER
ncbi:hypothetical protein G5I_04793 [Acromyrmex echinatior]|uniref:Uncharacterized protein n=1 Tax=Acromyrmex echinatior TaxID=103372 RepID=F4WGL1_ACREC|nr:hypothetical protein G5I_04793 [Acromyrmex echinatior]